MSKVSIAVRLLEVQTHGALTRAFRAPPAVEADRVPRMPISSFRQSSRGLGITAGISVLALIVVSCHTAISTRSPNERLERELISTAVTWAAADHPVVVVADSTRYMLTFLTPTRGVDSAQWRYAAEKFGANVLALRDPMLAANKQPRQLAGWLALPRMWQFERDPGTDSLLRSPRDDGFWGPRAESHYFIVPSRPAVADDSASALILIWAQCGTRCGDLSFVLLRRDGERWSVADHVLLGQS